MRKVFSISFVLVFGLLAAFGLLFFASSGFSPVSAAPAQLDVSGHITSDTTWTAANSPYVLTGDVTVDPGATLTIEAGVIVQGNSGTELQVQGRLIAIGTAAQPIVFTSFADSGPGQWDGLVFNGGDGTLEHVTVRYGGQNSNSQGYKSNITISGVSAGTVRIVESQVTQESYGGTSMGDYGIRIQNSSVVISNTLITNNGNDLNTDYGLYATGVNTLTVTGNTFSGNSGAAVRTGTANIQDFTNNTFAGNGYDQIRIDGGNVALNSRMTPQTGLEGYVVWTGSLVVPGEAQLTLDPGAQLMVKDTELQVHGSLVAEGTATQPITLTSLANSGPGQWNGLVIDGGSASLRNVTVRYGGRDRNSANTRSNIALVNNGALEIVSSRVISESYGGTATGDYGIYIDGMIALISDTLIAGNGNDLTSDGGIYVAGGIVSIRNSVFRNNGGHGMYLDGGMTAVLCSASTGNGNDGVYLRNNAELYMTSSALYDNGGMGLNNTRSVTVTATYNWWGAADGPGGAGPGSGDEVSDRVIYDPWLPMETCFADLGLTGSDAPDPVDEQTPLTYTLVITNSGPGIAESVQLTDTLPSGVLFHTAAATQGTCQETSGTVTCNLGDLCADDLITVTVAVTPTVAGVITNTVTVNGVYDPILENNTVQITTTVNFIPRYIYLPLVIR